MGQPNVPTNGLRLTASGPTVGEDGEALITRTGTGLQVSVDGAAPVPVGGGTANEIVATLSAPGQDIAITGLDGETDGDYSYCAELIFTDAGKCFIQPNGADPATASGIGVAVAADGTVVGLASESGVKILSTGTGGPIVIEGTLTSASGKIRFGSSNAILGGGAMWRFNYELNDTATVISSLTFHGSAAGLFDTGSYVRLIKLAHTTS